MPQSMFLFPLTSPKRGVSNFNVRHVALGHPNAAQLVNELVPVASPCADPCVALERHEQLKEPELRKPPAWDVGEGIELLKAIRIEPRDVAVVQHPSLVRSS